MTSVFETLFILALDEDEGYIVESVVESLETALAGAVLAELAVLGRLELRDNRVMVSNRASTGHPVLDKALNEILNETKLRKPRYWVNTLAYKKLLQDIGYDLVDQGVLSRHKKRLRLVGSAEEAQSQSPSRKYSLMSHLREIVLAGGHPELADLVLLSLLYHADLIRLIFTIGERKIAAREIKKLLSEWVEKEKFSETLQAIIAAACERS